MGYTHYWEMPDSVTDEDWAHAICGIGFVVDKHKDIKGRVPDSILGNTLLAYESDQPDEPPVVSLEKGVRFNGVGDNGYETFMVRRGARGRQYCKTECMNYDLAVCECLLVLRAHIPGFRLKSDGFSASLKSQENGVRFDGNWDQAIDNVKSYGLYYRGWISNKRDPYCDLGMILHSPTEGPDGTDHCFNDEGYEVDEPVTAVEKPKPQPKSPQCSSSLGRFPTLEIPEGYVVSPKNTTVATRGVYALISNDELTAEEMYSLIDKHKRGDWGELNETDIATQKKAIANGDKDRLMSSFVVGENKIWVITDPAWRVTTALLPEEY